MATEIVFDDSDSPSLFDVVESKDEDDLPYVELVDRAREVKPLRFYYLEDAVAYMHLVTEVCNVLNSALKKENGELV